VRINITEAEYNAVIAAEKKTKDKNTSKKLKVIILKYEGKNNSEIAAMLEYSLSRVTHLITEFRTNGIDEYIRNKYKGNNRNMTYEEEEEILKKFEDAANAGQVITVKEIKAAFDEKLGRDTGRGYIYMLLKRHNWRKIKPRPQHPKKADDETIAASKKLTNCWEKSS